MGQLTQSFITRLRNRDPLIRPDLWMVSDLLRRAWSRGYHSGFEEIDSEEFSSEEAGELREALLEAFYNETENGRRRALLFTLADAHEKTVKDELLRELHLSLEMHRVASAQLRGVLRSLEEIGEKVYDDSEISGGIDAVEQNIKAAERYLGKHGLYIPL